jgi:hypothetical protein
LPLLWCIRSPLTNIKFNVSELPVAAHRARTARPDQQAARPTQLTSQLPAPQRILSQTNLRPVPVHTSVGISHHLRQQEAQQVASAHPAVAKTASKSG